MIEVKTDKRSELTFKLNIEGTTKAKPVARLVIPLNSFSIFIKGKVLEERVVVEIPPFSNMKNYIPSGKVACFLEVIIGDNYFVPWEEAILFTHPIQVTAESEEKKKEEEATKISITMEHLEEQEQEVDSSDKEKEEPLTEEQEVEEEIPEEEPNENLKSLMKEEEKVPEEIEEEPEPVKEEPIVEEEEKVKSKPKKEHKKKYTYSDFLKNQNVSARDYLDSLFEKESE